MKKNLIATVMLLTGFAAFAPLPGQETGKVISLNGPRLGGPIIGSPYSAIAVTEDVQTLADGNRIVQKHTEKMYRDGQGRERSETAPASGEGFTAVISDPVAKTGYTLNSQTRTARQTPAGGFISLRVSPSPEQAAREDDLKALNAQLKVMELEVTARAALEAYRASDLAVQAPPAGSGGGRSGGPAIKAGPGGRGVPEGRGPAGTALNTVREDLPPQNIEGVYATGKRTTRTIPAGQIGNEKDIVVMEEVWYSPDLQMNVMTKHSDPRTGENTYRLTNINRAEPDPSLFQVPPDYTVIGKKQ
jgi:hypothetical protein